MKKVYELNIKFITDDFDPNNSKVVIGTDHGINEIYSILALSKECFLKEYIENICQSKEEAQNFMEHVVEIADCVEEITNNIDFMRPLSSSPKEHSIDDLIVNIDGDDSTVSFE